MNEIERSIYIFLIYVGVVSLIAVALTILDKYFAIAKKRRIPERVLILFALFGGALAEYAVMKMIRHKTLHKKFMIGLPLIAAVHLVLIVIAELFIHGVIKL